ncbi:MAG: phenylalanine--tRNA ligase subunit beta, partial [Gemmatimonadales bacterium]
GIAGVMGGRDTEVTNVTTDIVLECAWFNPVRVRRARRALDLSTDASQRFERGTDRWGAVEAFRRCLRLIVTVAGGVLDGAAVDCYPAPSHPARVFLRPSRVAQVLGVELSWTEIEKRLVALGATVLSKPDDGRIAVDVPGWRPDIVREIDLVEEVARLYGYDRLPVDLGRFRPGRRPDDPAWHATTRLRTALAAAGLSEIVTLPMVATAGPAAPRLLNPLSAEHGVLRDALLPSLVAQVEANWARQIGDIRLFEIGTVFANQAGGQAPLERLQIAFVVTGARRPPHWTDGGKPAMWDRWDAKGLFERVVAVASPDAVISVSGEQWRAERDGRIVGKCASLDAAFDVWANEVASPDAPLWAGAVFGGYVEVEDLMPHHAAFTPLAVYPAVSRDLALVLKGDVAAAALTGLLTERGVRHGLESATIIDEYRGPGSPDDTRSVTVRLIFRAADRTLTDSEVEQALGRLRTSLERERDVTIRTT